MGGSTTGLGVTSQHLCLIPSLCCGEGLGLGNCVTLAAALQATWYEETQALFAAVMSFWCGSRLIGKMRRVTEEVLNLVKRFECFSPTIYTCPVGYGHVALAHEKAQFAARITPGQATELLRKDVLIAEQAVLQLILVPLTDGQFDAMVSFTFNLGPGRYSGRH